MASLLVNIFEILWDGSEMATLVGNDTNAVISPLAIRHSSIAIHLLPLHTPSILPADIKQGIGNLSDGTVF
jgi:hypothetical protein